MLVENQKKGGGILVTQCSVAGNIKHFYLISMADPFRFKHSYLYLLKAFLSNVFKSLIQGLHFCYATFF